ncbi:hypothetical protein AGMMS50229_20090 [Campylobacterota bacterium]|nr:hypothetical protein AGMMS50229_20090 [Campylobacterota bacterium]
MNILAPRGSAKSTIGTLAYPLREALHGKEPYIWIISDTRSQAYTHLDNIKNELTENGKIRETYPEAFGKGPVWRSGGIMLRNGTVIEAYGTGQRLRGRRHREHRPSLIICDDLQNDGHIISATVREHSGSWFHGSVMKAGNNKTNVLNLATALHREAIGFELTERPGWISRTFRAIEHWPDNMPLWEEWESLYSQTSDHNAAQKAARFYNEHQTELHAGAVLLWPELEDLLTLMKMRAESGRTAFEREKQNSPVNPEHCEWPETYFDGPIWYEKLPDNIVVKTMTLDPSKGTDASRGDYSAYIMLALDSDGIYYADADLARRPIAEIVEAGVGLYRRFQPDVFGVEVNQFQHLMCDDFERAFRENGLPHVVPYPMENRLNKILRIRRLGPVLAGRRIRFKSHSPMTKLLIEQLKTFPAAGHDDGPDALEMAVRLIEMLLNK